MKKIADYTILEKIDQTKTSSVYRAQRDGSTCMVKVLAASSPSPSEIAQFKQEYHIIGSIESEYVVKVYDILPYNDTFALVLEDFNGKSLKHLITSASAPLGTGPFLSIAMKLAEALGHIHKKDIVHKDIKPHNILVNLEQGIVKITDFGIAQMLTHRNERIDNKEVIQGTLVYMSPEQTGRMNRPVDYRTDLYSLGVTFYEMLAGTVPFIFSDPLEIIHSHIARKPWPLHELYPDIPRVISDIVMKLLSKNPEERYQNSFGLAADIKECLKQLDQTGRIESFPLAQNDIPIRFNIPQRLFGRDMEIESLMEAYNRAASGSREIVLVSGYPGIGKSALIHEIYKPILQNKGYFISGKYEQFRRDVPYNSIIYAFQQLLKQILAQGDERISQWKSELLQGIGGHGRLIIDLIPELEIIIGSQPEEPELGPELAEKRLHYVFKKFVRVFAREEHPLVLFLDDLQWADSASIKLINMLLSDLDIRYFFFIGAYRDNEVSDADILATAIRDVEHAGAAINRIQLLPLCVADLTGFIAEFLRCTREKAYPLSELIHSKTYGNPFFVNQFMKILYDDGMLKVDPESGWHWDMDKINNMRVTDNVVELMAEKITRLSGNTQEVLKICACIGTRFDLETISIIFNKSVYEILEHLSDAMKQGLIAQTDDYYVFYHDRIQEAAYSLIPEQGRPILHFTIGRLFLENTEEEYLFDKIFYIVNQLNLGQKLITDQKERNELAELNLMAGKKARNSAAFSQMFNYLKSAIELLSHDSWEFDYELTLSIYVNAVEAAYTATYFDKMERLADIVLNNANNLLDTVKVYESKIQAYIAQNNLKKGLKTGLKVLKLFGIKFPEKPNNVHILLAYFKAKLTLAGKGIEDLFNMHQMIDTNKLAILRIMSKIVSSLYLAMPELLPLTIFKGVNLFIKYGNVAGISSFFYACYGVILCGVIKDIESGYKFGKLALDLLNKVNDKEFRTKTIFIYNSFIKPWKEHWKNSYKPFMDGLQSGMEYGDIEFAAHNAQMLSTFISFSSMDEIDKQIKEILNYHNTIDKLKQASSLIYTSLLLQRSQNLTDISKESLYLNGDFYYESEMLPRHLQENDRTALCSVYWVKTMLCFSFNYFKDAVEFVDKSEIYLDAMIANTSIPMIFFYGSLSRLAYYPEAQKSKQREMLKKVKEHQKKMKQFAHHAPMNYLHKYQLVEAEIARIKNDYETAMELYEKAISGAHKNEYIQEEAIAYECAARFYQNRGFKDIAAAYVTKAYTCYKKWGATAKLKDMEKRYSHLIFNKIGNKDDSFVSGSFTSPWEAGRSIDISTLLKASRAISGEIDLGRLLETLVRIAMENAGAEKGFFIFEKGNKKLYIEAERSINDNRVEVLHSIPIIEGEKLAVRVVEYVYNVKKYVILPDAFHKGMFVDDPYIKAQRVKSIFCAPILRKEKIIAIIYLENNQTTGAFTDDRLELIWHLAAQAAISIENARFIIDDKNKAVMEKEIEMARRIQDDLLPSRSDIPKIDKAIVDYKHVPVMGIGGDFVSINYNKAEKRLGLFICDVSGHGISAALTAAMVSMCLHFLWDIYIDEPARLLMVLRNSLLGKMGDNFFTAYICSLNLDNGVLTCASAGHPPLMIFRKTGTVVMIKPDGKIISDFIQPNHKNEYVQLYSGDRIVLYTDGVSEAHNIWIEDDTKLSEWLSDEVNKFPTIQALCDNLYDDLVKYTQNTNLDDDFAVLAMEYKG